MSGHGEDATDQDCPSAQGRTVCILHEGHAGVHIGANSWTWTDDDPPYQSPTMQDIPGEGWK